jgi:hypothetical protein
MCRVLSAARSRTLRPARTGRLAAPALVGYLCVSRSAAIPNSGYPHAALATCDLLIGGAARVGSAQQFGPSLPPLHGRTVSRGWPLARLLLFSGLVVLLERGDHRAARPDDSAMDSVGRCRGKSLTMIGR